MNRLLAIREWAGARGIARIDQPILIVVGAEVQTAVVSSSDLDVYMVQPPRDIDQAMKAGSDEVDRLIDAGTDLLALAGSDETAALITIGVLTKLDAAAILGLPTELDDDTWMRECANLRDRMREVRPHLGEQADFLRALDAPVIAYLVGAISRARSRNTPVLVDGLAATAAALIAQRSDSKLPEWMLLAQRTAHAAFQPAADRLALEPLLDLGLLDESGTASVLALPIVRASLLR
jgi:nicotinate-nucleotide--dimethylbenzimidazole phosphoribosyltransferase